MTHLVQAVLATAAIVLIVIVLVDVLHRGMAGLDGDHRGRRRTR